MMYIDHIWLDGMMGLVTGDALGCPVQFKNRSFIRTRGLVTGMEGHGTFDMPAGTWTDDSSMALATLSSIKAHHAIVPSDIADRFCDWLYHGAYTPFGQAFDLGLTCTDAIHRYAQARDTAHCGKTGEHANGNGALMRILPVCLFFLTQAPDTYADDDAIHTIHQIAGLTHNHLRSHIACGLYYFMAKAILKGRTSQDLQTCLSQGMAQGRAYYQSSVCDTSQLAFYQRLFDLEQFKAVPAHHIHSTGYVVDTLEAAIWSLLQTDHFHTALLTAVNLGDDTDTVGAVAGGLAGLYYGYAQMPETWLSVLQRRADIEALCLTY